MDEEGSAGCPLSHDGRFEGLFFGVFPRPRVTDFADDAGLDASVAHTMFYVADDPFSQLVDRGVLNVLAVR